MAFGTTLGLSFAIGATLTCITLFLGWIHTYYGTNSKVIRWLLLPTLGYGITVGLNTFVQSTRCPRIDMKQIGLTGLAVPLSVVLFLLLTLVGFIRAPIESAVPLQYRLQNGEMTAIAYYMFWAGMFGEAIAGGFAQACPAS
jgi:hypothetical protein